MAGDIYIGLSPERLKTTLGSCIALTAWHPVLKVGGMCHYLLSKPSRGEQKKPAWYYGDSALQELELRLQTYAPLHEFEFGLFGGGSLFFREYEKEGIAYANIEEALGWLDAKNIELKNFSVGGCECRSLCLDLQNGEIHLKVYSHQRAKQA